MTENYTIEAKPATGGKAFYVRGDDGKTIGLIYKHNSRSWRVYGAPGVGKFDGQDAAVEYILENPNLHLRNRR